MKKQTAGRDILGAIAPKFAELNDDVLFGEVWSREDELSPRDRSLITVTALISKGIVDSSLKAHLAKAKENGIGRSEMAEVFTHLSFYAGWPNIWAAFRVLMEVYGEEDESLTAFDRANVFGKGEPNVAYAKYFIGNSYLNPLTVPDAPLKMANVTFEPGCRNNWHIHHASKGGGQALICVAGEGWYQAEGEEPVSLTPGKIVEIPANVKHWHGAKKDSWFSHIAFDIPGEETSVEWLEEVHNDLFDD